MCKHTAGFKQDLSHWLQKPSPVFIGSTCVGLNPWSTRVSFTVQSRVVSVLVCQSFIPNRLKCSRFDGGCRPSLSVKVSKRSKENKLDKLHHNIIFSLSLSLSVYIYHILCVPRYLGPRLTSIFIGWPPLFRVNSSKAKVVWVYSTKSESRLENCFPTSCTETKGSDLPLASAGGKPSAWPGTTSTHDSILHLFCTRCLAVFSKWLLLILIALS